MSGPLRYQNPQLQELLASNYVAGTLRGPARKRMERLMRDNSVLSKRVRQWEAKLQPLHQATVPVEPKSGTWQSISDAINGAADPMIAILKRRLNIYKYLTAMAMTFALVAGVLLWYPQPDVTPAAAINYVAVMKNSDEQPTMVVTLTKSGRVMALDLLQKPKLEADQRLQLWAVSRDDGSIKSLGAVELEKHFETSLSKEQWGLISTAEYLLVSAEDQIDVQAPGEKIIAKGLCVKVEGWKS
ncbi:hypothetical protein FT643_05005 [Ketobacter sp. MCCC 1A13808]|uniref:anti-sigma factor n=1 Tax=Ketobacter sp. MCCC 1A13808 TaxID=2602738 RepID=UPI0012EC2736|nr:anti-sigma factor [Ketobacter sp. MCCC 1A13808]MVF11498.1 hypothetical protein [Ketobacter sp. MCCC 1A13808]